MTELILFIVGVAVGYFASNFTESENSGEPTSTGGGNSSSESNRNVNTHNKSQK